MDLGKTLNNETPNEQDASGINENLAIIRNLEAAATIQSEQQSTDNDKKTENDEENLDDPHSKSIVENGPQVKILAQEYQTNLNLSLLKQKRKIMRQEADDSEPKRRKTISLRRSVLLAQTKRKYLALISRSFELPDESSNSGSELKDFQDKKSRVADEEKGEISNESLRSLATRSPSVTKSKRQSTPPCQSKDETAKKKPSSSSAQSSFVPIISHVTSMGSQSTDKRSGKDVWEHFILFLELHKESFDRAITDRISRDDMEVASQVNPCLKNPAETVGESISQSLVKPAKTETESEKTESQGRLKKKISSTSGLISVSVTIELQKLRFYAMRKMKEGEEFMMKERRKISDWMENNECPLIKDLKIKHLGYHKFLCDYEYFFKIMKKEKICANIARLTDLPLSATHIMTFYLFFLYLHNSLYSEVPMENIFKIINFENCLFVYRKYQVKKSRHETRVKMLERIAVQFLDFFNVYVEKCRLEIKSEIPHSENMSLEDYQNYIKDLRTAIRKNLNCLRELFSDESSTVSQVRMYFNESRKSSILTFIFLDNKRPEVFPKLS